MEAIPVIPSSPPHAPWPPLQRKHLFILAFPLGYAASFLATSYYAVYHLDWWDVKFADPAGNFEISRRLLPYFTVVATLSHLGGLAASRQWLRVAPSWRIAGLGLVAGVVVNVLRFLHSVATRDLPPRHPWTGVHEAVALGLIFLGPAVITWLVWWLANIGRRTAEAGGAASADGAAGGERDG